MNKQNLLTHTLNIHTMNKQTTRELAIDFWEDLSAIRRRILTAKYFPIEGLQHYTSHLPEIEHIYLSENPQTETIKEEDVQVGGFTGGKWEYKIYDNEIFKEIEIGIDGLRTCVIPYLEAPAEANAQRIVTCVNNFDSMYRFIKELNRRLLDSQNRVGGSGSFGDTYHVIFDGNKSVGQVMEAILNNISNK
jgi:hypothetical protein